MKRQSGGFTLIELVVALTISAVVVGFIATFIAVPVRAHTAQARRAELASSAEMLARAMAEDVRTALPGSPRAYLANGHVVLELIRVLGVARYCEEVGAICTDKLDFTTPDSQFDVLDPQGVAAGFIAVTDNDPGNAASAQDAYALTNVIAAAQDTTVQRVRLQSPFRFLERSPNNRAFLVADVTRYECDPIARTLRRYGNRPLPAAAGPVGAGAPSDLVAGDVAACRFTYVAPPLPPARPQNGGLVVVEITISRTTDGAVENLRVIKQLTLEYPA
jgi:MSHA biogenesis protein MshO